MSKRSCPSWIFPALLLAAFLLSANCVVFAQEPLPDAPAPQKNAPPPAPAPTPDPTAPLPDASSDSGTAPSQPNPADSGKTRPSTDPQSPPPASQGIKTVPSGKATGGPGNDFDELFTLTKNVNFVSVPVTVKDREGKMVDGLLSQDFSIYEDNVKQKITFFTSDPFPLAAALVIDLGISDTTLRKVSQTYSALDGSFGPFDNVAVFTYGNTVQQQSDFGNTRRLELTLQRIRDAKGETSTGAFGGPFSGPSTNGKPVDPNQLPFPAQSPQRVSHVLNDAILMAATDLARQPRATRKIIFVVSNGYEYGSRASYSQVLKVLLTNNIAVYAINVEPPIIPGMNKLDKLHIPGQGYTDILPKYSNATGGDVLDSSSRESIENAYQSITSQARNQYTIGYTTPQNASSTYRDIEVRVKRPNVMVTAKHGYYPLPPQREAPAPATPPADQKPSNPPGTQP